MIRVIKNLFFEELVFFIALGMAVLSGMFADFHFEAIDLNVLGILAALMLITLAFEKYQLLDFVAVAVLKKADSERNAAAVMVLLTAFLGMLITNDVALITVVPITITLSKKVGFNPYKLIILEALAANIGSSLTPFGNPQNLYLYSAFKFEFLVFLRTVAPFVAIGLLLLIIPIMLLNKTKFVSNQESVIVESKYWVGAYGLLFILAIVFIVLRLNILYVLLLVSACVLMKDRELFLKLDYFLLGTFVGFFVFVDHVNQFDWINEMIRSLLSSDLHIFYTSAILSQGISNVPAAILLSAFTSRKEALLLGVSVGGLGTMIASLANLIAYKFYVKQFSAKPYHKYFLLLNFSLLLFFMVMFFLILR